MKRNKEEMPKSVSLIKPYVTNKQNMTTRDTNVSISNNKRESA